MTQKSMDEQLIAAFDKFNSARIELQEVGRLALKQEAPEASVTLGNIWRFIFQKKYDKNGIVAASIIMPHLVLSNWEISTNNDNWWSDIK